VAMSGASPPGWTGDAIIDEGGEAVAVVEIAAALRRCRTGCGLSRESQEERRRASGEGSSIAVAAVRPVSTRLKALGRIGRREPRDRSCGEDFADRRP